MAECSRCGAELTTAYANVGTAEKPLLCYWKAGQREAKRKEAEGQMEVIGERYDRTGMARLLAGWYGNLYVTDLATERLSRVWL